MCQSCIKQRTMNGKKLNQTFEQKISGGWKSLAIAAQEKDLETARKMVYYLKYHLGTWKTKPEAFISDLDEPQYQPIDPDVDNLIDSSYDPDIV